ncbi:hypothetical protein [Candidatus Palauibacter sp.]|uniref:hypothetical protein n=1 Tax=Candidatus Palauibacter sp. TaxID=3101350 RepID=UPI003C6EF5C0
MAARGWFDIAIDAGTSFKPGLPVDLEVTYTARFETSSADLRVTLPEVEVAKRSGWDRTYKTGFGVELPTRLHSRQALAAGATATQTTVLVFPVAGIYRIHARATAAEFQPSDATTRVTRTTHEYLWVLVDGEGGRTLRDFDPSVIPAGFVPQPGPFRRFGTRPGSRGSDASTGTQSLANSITSATAAGNTADCAGGDVCFQVQYYDYDSTKLKPVPALPYSLSLSVTGANGSSFSHSGLTGQHGDISVPCPLLRTPGYAGKASFSMMDGDLIIDSDDDLEFILAGNACGHVTEITIPSAAAKTWITAKRMIAKSQDLFRSADQAVTFELNPQRAISPNTANVCWYLDRERTIVVLEGRGGGFACLWGPWGSFVFAHEYGHHLHHTTLGGLAYYRTCAGHRAFLPFEMGCAYNEGWADYHAMRTEPEYDGETYQYHYHTEEDYENNRGLDRRQQTLTYTHFTSADQDGSLYHGEITAFFHDLIDPINEAHDSLDLDESDVLTVMSKCEVTWATATDTVTTHPNGIDHLIWCLEGAVDSGITGGAGYFDTHDVPDLGIHSFHPMWQNQMANARWPKDDIRRLWFANLYGKASADSSVLERPALPTIPDTVRSPPSIVPPPTDSMPPQAHLVVSCDESNEFDCTLDGSGSTDNQRIVSYTWYVDDAWVASGSSATLRHKVHWEHAADTTVTFSLSVEDPSGWWDYARVKREIIDDPPTAQLTIDDCEGLICTLNGTGLPTTTA